MAPSSKDIRELFLAYFERNGHSRQASASLVPQDDPTLMFTNAGMVPFKRLFLGEETRNYNRATTSQKCMRVSGKHNDLENVGRTPRHHTFFEMLGNFSFGDYFKKDAIDFAWELLTNELKLSPERLAVSIYTDDDEAYDLWQTGIGIPDHKIYRLGEEENFWSMGETGPCGPCSEIHIDFGETGGCTSTVCDPSCDCGRWLEIWNLVFMQFNRSADGSQEPLPKPSVDTGGGLERWAQVLQGVETNYDTDLFVPLIERGAELTDVTPGSDPEKDVSLRVVADHARALSFLIGDGVLPSNEGRGYVLRRILRRASRHGVLLGTEQPFIHGVADKVIDEMCDAYPDLVERREFITSRIKREEERFLETLSKGLKLLEDEISNLSAKGETTLPGETLFQLYDTYGFPVDLTADILVSRDMDVDQAGFDREMDAQRSRARAAWKGSGDTTVAEVYGRIVSEVTCEFTGYTGLVGESSLAALLRGGEPVDEAEQGDEVELVFAETPFYAESGGQVGDRGTISFPAGEVEVSDTQKPLEGLIVHRGKIASGTVRQGEVAQLAVDAGNRQAIVRNHSATHLLHAALRQVLGAQAMQKGSLVEGTRLRFDFTHDHAVTPEEIERIEDIANQWIEENHPGETRLLSYDEAVKQGAMALFEEKYGDEVRVVSFGDCSTELCGGTHARATGDIGLLKVVSESGISAGVRRIEALSGMDALHYLRDQERALRDTAGLLKVAPAEVHDRVAKLLDERKAARRELDSMASKKQGDVAGDLAASAREIAGGKALAARVEGSDAKAMRSLIDDLRNKLGSGVVCLLTESKGKVLVAIGATKDQIENHKAGDLIREVAGVVGGGGGGRPDFAQAGGKDASKIDDAIAKFYELVGAN
ncbi:MAG: alanine--tRNA ligase [Myxococcota bacterium]|jgi:alanyl-tRNA synthetase|nr:alanine--tRNA ligase [Myxococcota bacterium]